MNACRRHGAINCTAPRYAASRVGFNPALFPSNATHATDVRTFLTQLTSDAGDASKVRKELLACVKI